MKRYAVIVSVLVLMLGGWSADMLAQEMKVGMAWMGKSGSSNRFQKILTEDFQAKAPTIQLEVVGEIATEEEFAALVARFQQEKAGMIILRSTGSEWLAKHPTTIPTFIGGGNHPGYLNVVKNLAAPEGNITGVTYYVPVNTQFEIFQAIIPNLTSLWLLLEKGHPSSLIDQEQTKKYCDELKIAYHESLCSSPEEVVAAVKEAVAAGVSAIVLGNQAIPIDNAKAIVAAAGMTPTLSYLSPPVKEGVLGGFNADEIKLAHILAESVIDVLVNGKPIREVPIKFDPTPEFTINETTAQKLQLTVPYEILKHAVIVK